MPVWHAFLGRFNVSTDEKARPTFCDLRRNCLVCRRPGLCQPLHGLLETGASRPRRTSTQCNRSTEPEGLLGCLQVNERTYATKRRHARIPAAELPWQRNCEARTRTHRRHRGTHNRNLRESRSVISSRAHGGSWLLTRWNSRRSRPTGADPPSRPASASLRSSRRNPRPCSRSHSQSLRTCSPRR